MAKVTSLKKDDKLITATLKQMADIEFKLAMTRNQLKDPPLGTVRGFARQLLEEKVGPSLVEIKNAQDNIERLKNLRVAVEKVKMISDLADDLLIDVAIFKKNLEEIKLRSTAMAQVQAAVKKNLLPAINKIHEIKSLLMSMS